MSWSQGRDTARAAVGDARREPTFPSSSSTHSAGLSRRSGLSLAGAIPLPEVAEREKRNK